MGICASKKDQFEVDSPSSPLPPKQSAKRNIHKQLLDLKNLRKVPLLSLVKSQLYLKRKEKLKTEDNLSESASQTRDETRLCPLSQ